MYGGCGWVWLCGDNIAGEKVQISLMWDFPDTGVFKLNVDGSCKTASGNIGAGVFFATALGIGLRDLL
ncbi:unnamed protein product [Prunus brigantina]